MAPQVSVVVPVFNSENTVKRCLEALFSQSFPERLYEVIVVDDGSNDSTPSVVKAFPVKYIRQENAGPASARNRGAQAARGEIILFTDADCVPRRDWIGEMTRPFEMDPEVAAVKGAYVTEQQSIAARFAQIEFEERFKLLSRAETIDMVDTYSAGFRRDVFLAAGGFDTSFPAANNEDTELSYRLSKEGRKMVFNPRAVVCHLGHPDSVPAYARLKFWRGYWRMAVYRRFPEKALKDRYTPQSLKFEILALCLLVVGALAFPVFPGPGLLMAGLSLTVFFILATPFAVSAAAKDPAVGLLSPLLLLVRAAAIGAGALWGLLSPGLPRRAESASR